MMAALKSVVDEALVRAFDEKTSFAWDKVDVERLRPHLIKLLFLDAMFIFGIALFLVCDFAEFLRAVPDQALRRIIFWPWLMSLYMAVVLLIGTGILQIPKLLPRTTYETCVEDGEVDYHYRNAKEKEREDHLCTLVVLPVVVSGFIIIAAVVVFRASKHGELTARTGLAFEDWATLLVGGGLWGLLQACAVVVLRKGHTFGCGVFAGAVIPAMMPFGSDAFDTSKDLCFAALVLQHPDENVRWIGWVSCALIVSVHLRLLLTHGGRFELRASYLTVFFAVAQDSDKKIDESTSHRMALTLFMQLTPDRATSLICEDAPQSILAVIYFIICAHVKPFLLCVNVVIPSMRICAAKLLYRRLLSRGFILQALIQPLFKDDLPETTRTWTLTHLREGIRTYGAKAILDKTLHSYPKNVGEEVLGLVTTFLIASVGSKRVYLAAQKSLELIQADIDDAAAENLAEFLKANNTLRSLNLYANRIGAKGAAAVTAALEANSTLTHLNLAKNQLGAEGAAAVARLLEANAFVEELLLGGNNIGDEGAVALAKALQGNASLKSLTSRGNELGDKSAIAFAELVKGADCPKALESLILEFNDFGDAGKEALEGAKATIQERGGALVVAF